MVVRTPGRVATPSTTATPAAATRVASQPTARAATPGYTYEPREQRFAEERATRRLGMQFDSIIKPDFPIFKATPKVHLIRVMPPTWEKPHEHYGIDVHIHRNVGPDNGTYLCRAKMLNEPCAVCDERRGAEREGDAETVKALKIGMQVIIWVIDRDAEELGPQVWPMPPSVDQEFVLQSQDRRTRTSLLVDDPFEGFDIEFERAGTKMEDTKYKGVKVARSASPLSSDPAVLEKWMQYIVDHPLPTVLNYYDNEYVRGVLTGQVGVTEDDAQVVREEAEHGAGTNGAGEPSTPANAEPGQPQQQPVAATGVSQGTRDRLQNLRRRVGPAQ